MMRFGNSSLIVLVLFGTLSGCGDGRPERVPVSGKVLIDGRPLTYGAVRFTPAQGRSATSDLSADGSFELGTFERGDGAVPGEHAVTVHAAEHLNSETVRWHTPKKYQSAKASGIVKTINGPTDSLVIELTWAGEKGPFDEKTAWGE